MFGIIINNISRTVLTGNAESPAKMELTMSQMECSERENVFVGRWVILSELLITLQLRDGLVIYALLTKHEVKTAGYWPRSLFVFLLSGRLNNAYLNGRTFESHS